MGKLFTLDQSTDVQEVGSLGAFLAHAVREGMAVVDGFILPIDCGLQDGVSNELHRAFEQLGTPTVILRASLIDNFTDGEVIRGVDQQRLIGAITYMQANAARRNEKVAIVIQKTLNAEVAGTVYSINPATRDPGEILIEADLWMGNTVLAGDSDTDMVLVNKRSGAISLENKSEDEICVSAEQVEKLYSMTRKVERFTAFPAYIDWAFDNGKLYIIRIGPMDWDIYQEFNS